MSKKGNEEEENRAYEVFTSIGLESQMARCAR